MLMLTFVNAKGLFCALNNNTRLLSPLLIERILFKFKTINIIVLRIRSLVVIAFRKGK